MLLLLRRGQSLRPGVRVTTLELTLSLYPSSGTISGFLKVNTALEGSPVPDHLDYIVRAGNLYATQGRCRQSQGYTP